MKHTAVAVRDVSVAFRGRRGAPSTVVHHLDLDLLRGQVTVLLGESGSGKTVFSRAVGGMAPRGAIVTGSVGFEGNDILALPHTRLRQIHGRDIGFVAQDPSTSLDPMRRVGAQVAEVIQQHSIEPTRAGARKLTLRLFDMVRIVDPERVARCYPHQLSGGMRQRIAIAAALACQPRFLIADEPSSALDAAVGARVVDLMNELRADLGTSILFITHDIGAAHRIASAAGDQVAVMLSGRLVELGDASQVLTSPRHPYTQALIAAEPSAQVPRGSLATVPDEVRNAPAWGELEQIAPGHFVAKEAA